MIDAECLLVVVVQVGIVQQTLATVMINIVVLRINTGMAVLALFRSVGMQIASLMRVTMVQEIHTHVVRIAIRIVQFL